MQDEQTFNFDQRDLGRLVEDTEHSVNRSIRRKATGEKVRCQGEQDEGTML
jgi:hypothetical protein